jgi:hypothetical protein
MDLVMHSRRGMSEQSRLKFKELRANSRERAQSLALREWPQPPRSKRPRGS